MVSPFTARFVLGLGECFGAELAAEAPESISVLSEALALGMAVVSGRIDLDLSSGQRHNEGVKRPCGFGLRLAPSIVASYRRDLVSSGRPRTDSDHHLRLREKRALSIELRGRKNSLLLFFIQHRSDYLRGGSWQTGRGWHRCFLSVESRWQGRGGTSFSTSICL